MSWPQRFDLHAFSGGVGACSTVPNASHCRALWKFKSVRTPLESIRSNLLGSVGRRTVAGAIRDPSNAGGNAMAMLTRSSSSPRSLRSAQTRAATRAVATAALVESLEQRTFLSATSFSGASNYAVPGAPDFVTLADLNGDGYKDLIVSSYDASGLSVRLGRSD